MDNITKAVYINLTRRTDRKAEFEEELRRMDIRAQRFPAIEAKPGMIGCHSSHLAVLKMARSMGWENVLVFEDDYQFVVDKETLNRELQRFFDLKIPYDVLMLAYNLNKSEDCNEVVGYARDVQNAAGYIVHKRFYDTLIANLEEALPLLKETLAHWKYLNDQCWKTLQPTAEWFYLKTRCGIQRPSYSDLAERHMDYGT